MGGLLRSTEKEAIRGSKLSKMTRSELIQAVAARFKGLSDEDVDMSVRELLDALGGAMVAGNRVEIRGFGSFDLSYRPARTGRNPKTGESVKVPGKSVPHFKPGLELRQAVQNTTTA